MSEAAVVGEGTEVNKGENARMASFVGALAIGEYCHFSPHTRTLVIFFFSKLKPLPLDSPYCFSFLLSSCSV